MNKHKKVGAIILAAGKGSRMKSGKTNKVVLPLAEKPLILHAIHLLEKMKFEQIIVVVGFAKDSVKKVLKDSKVSFVEQKKRMGTAHAAKTAISVLDPSITEVLIIQGDDSHFYSRKTISDLKKMHLNNKSSLTFLTIHADNPIGLGRVVRSSKGDLQAITEERDADSRTKKIKEVNPACYMFDVDFLRKFINKVPKSEVTGEYYLTSLIDIAIKNKKIIKTVKGGRIPWRGVNTKEELYEAEKIYKSLIG